MNSKSLLTRLKWNNLITKRWSTACSDVQILSNEFSFNYQNCICNFGCSFNSLKRTTKDFLIRTHLTNKNHLYSYTLYFSYSTNAVELPWWEDAERFFFSRKSKIFLCETMKWTTFSYPNFKIYYFNFMLFELF